MLHLWWPSSPGEISRKARHSAWPSAQVPWTLGKQLWLKRADRVNKPPPGDIEATKTWGNCTSLTSWTCHGYDGCHIALITLGKSLVNLHSTATKIAGIKLVWTMPVPSCKALVRATPAAVLDLSGVKSSGWTLDFKFISASNSHVKPYHSIVLPLTYPHILHWKNKTAEKWHRTLVNVNQPAAKIAVDLSRSTVPQLFEGLHLADLRAMWASETVHPQA